MERNKLKYSDLKDVCRLCLSAGRKIGIFEEEGQHRQIGYKMRSCLSDLVYPGDPLPQSICPECLVKLENNYDFLQKCLKNFRILTNILFEEGMEHIPEVQKYIELKESGMHGMKPTINVNCVEDDSRGGSVEEQDGDDDDYDDDRFEWQPAGPLIDLEPPEEMFRIFVQDGPSNPFQPESDDLVLVNAEANLDNSVALRNMGDHTQENPDEGTAVEDTPVNLSEPTMECSGSALEEILSRVKQEPEDVEQIEEQEIEVTWLMQSTDQEDVLDISKVKTEPVPLSLAMVKQEQSEPTTVPIMAISNADVKEEPSTSSAPRTRSRTMNVECSKCFLVFHREIEILRHRCIGVTAWYCEPCNKYYKTKETFSRHKRFSCHSKVVKCIVCDSVFSNKIDLAHHQIIHLKIKITKLDVTKLNTCKTCLRTFSSKASLNMHEKCHLSVNEMDHYSRGTESKFPHHHAVPQNTETCSGLLHSSNRDVPAQQCAEVTGKTINQYHCTRCKAVFTNQKRFNAHNRQICLKNPYKHKNQSLAFETERNEGEQQRPQPAAVKLKVTDKKHSPVDLYTCIICRKSFDTQEILIEHKKLHTAARTALNTRPFSSFTTANGTLPVSEWVCKICGLDCRRSEVLWSHMHAKHSRLSYKCHHCQKTFDKSCSLRNHEKTHEPKLKCTACGKQYSTQKALAAHEQSKHLSSSAAHLCRKCNIKFDSRSALLIHARNHPSLPKEKKDFASVPSKSQTLHACSICAKTFARYDSLKRHERNHATSEHIFYPCSFCGLKFESVPKYRAHTLKHFQECPTCKQTFFTQDFCKHACLKQQHGPSTSHATNFKEFKCELCNAEFGTQQARNSHMRIHKKNWKYSTLKMEKNTPIFKRNVQNSRNIAPIIYCPICSKAFLSKGELQLHLKLLHPKK